MNLYLRCSALLLFAIFCNGARAQHKKAQIDSLLKHAAKLGILNGNVLVVEKGIPFYQASFGYADASGKIKLTPQFRFHIGSIAKEFNAVAIMMLQEQGKLKLEDKLSKFVSGLPEWADSVAVIHLLQYTSGIPDIRWNTVHGDEDVLTALRQTGKLDFEPGSQYAYNNSNIFFQRMIIANVSGMSFADYVRSKMLKRSGMTASVIDPTEKDLLMAKSFSNAGQQDPLTYPQSGWTAVTLGDFYKWSQALNTFKLITPASTAVIITPYARNKQAGLGSGTLKDHKIIDHRHDGTARNYQALLDVDNTKGRTIIWMTNSRNMQMFAVSDQIKNILDGKPYTLPKKSLFELLRKKADSAVGNAVIRYYEELKPQYAAEYAFDNESELNTLGYYLMGKGRLDDAILIFTYNTKLFPSSGNVFDSLGEAYYNKGDWQHSLMHYTRSVVLDSTNLGAREKIVELRKKVNSFAR